MARRANLRLHPAWFALVGFLAIAAVAAGYFIFTKASDPYRTMQTLNVGAYMENANSLRGNIYRVTGAVWNSLGWSPSDGRLYAIEVGDNTPADLLPVLVPVSLNQVNLQKGQRFIFEIEVGEGGVLLVRSLRKA